MIHFRVDGKPVPKQSFRYSKRGHYQPARLTAWEAKIRQAAIMAHFGHKISDGKWSVRLIFYLPDERRRDLDNLSKAVLDACNLHLWLDDTQVAKLEIEKTISPDNPGVEFFGEELE